MSIIFFEMYQKLGGFFKIFTWLCQVLSCGMQDLFSCGTWDLVPWLGIEPMHPKVEAQSLHHWTTRDVL